MNIDWPVAIGVFVVFAAWSFVYYAGFFHITDDFSGTVDAAAGKVIRYMEVPEYRMPVVYDSPDTGRGVLFAAIGFPPGMESGAGVFSGGSRLDCMLTGSGIYWEDDLDAGENRYEIAYSEADTGWCKESVETAGANQTYPLAAVRTYKVSLAALAGLEGESYQAFRESLGIQNELRIEWSGDSQGSFGPGVPINTDVHVRKFSRPLMESGSVDIRVMIWDQ